MDDDRRHDLDPLDPPSEDEAFDFLTAPLDPVAGEEPETTVVEAEKSEQADEVVAESADVVEDVEDVEEIADAEPALLTLAPPPVARLVSVPSEPELPLEPFALVPDLEPEVVEEPVAVEPEPEPVAVEPEPVVVEPEPVAVEPEPVAVEPEPVVVEPEREPALLPEPVAVEPEPVVVVEPVVEEPVAAVPFWKKEISLGGKKEPKAKKESKEARERRPRRERERPAAILAVPADEAKPVPFWKKELGGKKAPKAEPAAVVTAAAEVVAEDEKPVPFWKKEIGGKKAPKAGKPPKATKQPKPPKEPKAKKQPKAKPVVADAAEADEPEKPVPFWRKEISLGGKKGEREEQPKPPKRERPSRQSRRADTAEAVEAVEAEVVQSEVEQSEPVVVEAPAADEAPTEERVPFYRRELGGKRAPRAPRERRPVSTPRRAKAAGPADEKTVEAKPKRTPRRGAAAVSRAELPETPKAKKTGGKRQSGPKRHKKLVGLKIGASQLAAAQVVNNGHAELVKVAREPLDVGIISGGELRDPEALTLALKEFFNKHKLPKRGVRLGIANNRIGVRTFEIAGIDDEKQLANAVRFRAQEALPIPIEEAVLDWRILSESVDETGQKTRRVLLVVAYRELIDRYVEACAKAGVKLVGVDLEAFALLRALGGGAQRGGEEGALVAVSVGHERSTFAVSDGEVCEFTRVLDWGGHALNVAIARALEKTPSEVEDVKLGLSLDDTPEELPAGLSQESADKAREAVRRQLQTFARELVSSLQFYQNQPGSLGIGEVVLTGGTTQLPGLAHELERLVGVRVRVGDPLSRVKTSKRIDEDGLASLSVAIGLGIED